MKNNGILHANNGKILGKKLQIYGPVICLLSDFDVYLPVLEIYWPVMAWDWLEGSLLASNVFNTGQKGEYRLDRNLFTR